MLTEIESSSTDQLFVRIPLTPSTNNSSRRATGLENYHKLGGSPPRHLPSIEKPARPCSGKVASSKLTTSDLKLPQPEHFPSAVSND